ncbi:hypothetical protein KA005_51050 [bacterium]|nr:hypothetical protein [bacterium]
MVQPHEFSLSTFALKGKSIDKIENKVFEMFDKMHSDEVITNNPREYHKPNNDFIEPDRVLIFYLYETKE